MHRSDNSTLPECYNLLKTLIVSLNQALTTHAAPLARSAVVAPRQPGAAPPAIARMIDRAQSLPHPPPGAVDLSNDPSGEVSTR